jgi:multisubunit Na+/H+ antiporter MnhC subunit
MSALLLTMFVISVLLNAFLVGQLFKLKEENDQFISKLRQYPQAKRVTRNQLN